MSVHKRPLKKGHTWQAIVRIKGYPTVCETFDRQQEAIDWEEDTKRKIKRGQFRFDQHNQMHTFAQLTERYLTDGALEHHRSSDMASLSALLSYAYQNLNWINENPAFRLIKLKESPGRDRVLSEDEISRLLIAARQSKSPYLYCIILISFLRAKQPSAASTSRKPGSRLLNGPASPTAVHMTCATPFAPMPPAKGASNLQLQTATGHRTLNMLLHYTHMDVEVTKQFSNQISQQILKETPEKR